MKIIANFIYQLSFLFIIIGCANTQYMNNDAARFYNKGNEYLRLGEYKKAIDAYDQAIIFQDDYRIYYQRGIALKSYGNLDEAKKSFLMCINKKPDFAGAYNALGSIYFSLGKYQHATDNFQMAYDMTEDNTIKEVIIKNIAISKLNKAVSDTIPSIDINSEKKLKDIMDKGLHLEKEGKLQEALGIYHQVASMMPKFADVYARMTYTLRKMGYARQSSGMLDTCQELGGIKKDSPYAMNAHFVGGWFLTDELSVRMMVEQELLTTEATAKALMYSSNGYWVLIMVNQDDGVPIINNTPTIGIGSELRFDHGDWVTFLGKQYRKGGVKVLKTGLEFFEETERLGNGEVEVLLSGKWIKQ